MPSLQTISFDLMAGLRDCLDRPAFADRLRIGLDHFGFDQSVISRIPEPGDDLKSNVLASTHPPAWSRHYYERKYENVDPIFQHVRSEITPVIWSDIPVEKGSLPWRVMGDARSFALENGVSIPIINGRGQRSQVSLASSHGEIRRDGIHLVHLVAVFAHHCIAAIEEEKMSKVRVVLTARERECINWAAAGKTYWETGVILGIAEDTIKFHMKKAAEKLGTRAITAQIVAAAFRQSLIS